MPTTTRVILFCFAQAVCEAVTRSKWIGGSSEWRDAQAVVLVARNPLYGDGKAYLR
jgi:hypothetical protein